MITYDLELYSENLRKSYYKIDDYLRSVLRGNVDRSSWEKSNSTLLPTVGSSYFHLYSSEGVDVSFDNHHPVLFRSYVSLISIMILLINNKLVLKEDKNWVIVLFYYQKGQTTKVFTKTRTLIPSRLYRDVLMND